MVATGGVRGLEDEVYVSTQTLNVVSELHRSMDYEAALSWFNGILSGDDWAMRDRVEVVSDDGLRTIHLTVWGSRWTLEVDIEESQVLGGVIVSARVKDPAVGHVLPELAGLARALVP
jgi:hypothetical protein